MKTAKRYYSLTDILNDPNLYRIVIDYITNNDVTVKEFWPWIKSLGYTMSRAKVGKILAYFMEQGIVYKKGSKYTCPCGYRTDSQKHHSSHAQMCPWFKMMMDLAKNDILTMEYVIDQVMNHDKIGFDIATELVNEFSFPNNIVPNLTNHTNKLIKEAIKEGLIDKDHYDRLLKKAYHERSKETIKQKYGVENISQLEEVKQKKRETCRKHFGVDYSQQSPEVRAKTVASVRKKYGVDNVSQSPQVKLKKAKTFEEHYGIDNIFSNREYIQQAWKEKLGVDNPTKRPDIAAKSFNTRSGKRIDIIAGESEFKVKDELTKFLDSLGIKYSLKHNEQAFHDQERIYIPDFIIKLNDTDIIIEVQNPISHPYPDEYRDRKIAPSIRAKMVNDLRRLSFLKSKGFYVFAVWERQLQQDLDFVKNVLSRIARNQDIDYDRYWTELTGMYRNVLDR